MGHATTKVRRQVVYGGRGVAAIGGPATARDQALELVSIQFARLNPQDVSAALRNNRSWPTSLRSRER